MAFDNLQEQFEFFRGLPSRQAKRLYADYILLVRPLLEKYRAAIADGAYRTDGFAELVFTIEPFAQPLSLLYLELKHRNLKTKERREEWETAILVANYAKQLRSAFDDAFLEGCGIQQHTI